MADQDVLKSFIALKGVGEAKAQLLMDNGIDTMDKLQKATKKQLTDIKGISEANAKEILDQVKPKQTPTPKKTTKPAEKKQAPPAKQDKPAPKKETPTDKPKEKPKKTTTPKESKEEKEEDVEIIEEKEEIKVKKKPKLTSEQKNQLEKRKEIKKRTPNFLREEWFRYKRIPKNWRRPDGLTSSMRKHRKYRPHVVRVGFRGPKDVRGLHSSGFEEIMVHNIADLEQLNPDTQAARISGTVGTRKRLEITKKADELEIRVLNRGV